MNEQLKKALKHFREKLEERLSGIRVDANLQKGDDIVDDAVCDSITWGAREIAEEFNCLAPHLDLSPINVPEELEKSLYQEDD